MSQKFVALLVLSALFCAVSGCSSVGPRKYVFFGDPQPEKVEMFEDFWKDYPFKPDDPSLPLRRGKGGVIRFFKKNNYTRAIMVDGDLTVNVYHSQKEGVTLTQPDERMVLTSKELNEKHRKYDKENGYSYHIYLDLGEYDQPEEEITILSVFTDAKTGQATLSKEIRTTVMGTSPAKKTDDGVESEAERIARKKLGLTDEDADPIAALQARYSARNRAKEEANEKTAKTRERDNIDISDSQFEDAKGDGIRNASYLESINREQEKKTAELLEQNREKREYYRDKRRRDLDEYLKDRESRADGASSLREAPTVMESRSFNAQSSYVDLAKATSQNYGTLSTQIGEQAMRMYDESQKAEPQSAPPITPGYREPNASDVPKGYEEPKSNPVRADVNTNPSELDKLDDFQVDGDAPPTEVYVKKYGAY